MAPTPRAGRLLPAIALVALAAVVVHGGWRRLGHPRGPVARDSVPVEATGAAQAGPAPARRHNDPAAVRERILAEGGSTYIGEMLAEHDSMLRRWRPREGGDAIRVAVVPGGAAGFSGRFPGTVAWAITRWNGVGLPVSLVTGADSSSADILVTWVDSLGGNRAGRADVTWNGDGEIVHAAVVLATRAPDGRVLEQREMVTIALHELGHALGLGHSPARDDAMYPETAATELTARDRRTAALLYSLPSGSVRD